MREREGGRREGERGMKKREYGCVCVGGGGGALDRIYGDACMFTSGLLFT